MNITPFRQSIPVMILCGGTGTRLREETEFRPKPMVEIGGKPILWHIMKIYAHYGYKDFILCLGYRGHQIKDYFLNHQHLTQDFHLDLATNTTTLLSSNGQDDFRIVFAETGPETLTAERVLIASKYVQTDEFMLTYGDGVSNVDLNRLKYFHEQKRATHATIGTITGIHPKHKYGLLAHTPDQLLESFVQYPRLPDYTNGGFMLLNREILSYCKPGEMIEDALMAATAQKKIALYQHEGFWHAMDTMKDKEDLEKLWKNNPEWKLWS